MLPHGEARTQIVLLRPQEPLELIREMMVLQERIELSTSPLPRECSTTELLQHPRLAAHETSGFLPQQAGQGKAAESGSVVPRPAPRAEVQCEPID